MVMAVYGVKLVYTVCIVVGLNGPVPSGAVRLERVDW